jgi:hypothetical protein
MRTAHRSRRSIPPRSAFAGFRFPSDVIVLAVRWYLRFGLSYRDLEELLADVVSRSTTSPSTGGCCGSHRCWPRRVDTRTNHGIPSGRLWINTRGWGRVS